MKIFLILIILVGGAWYITKRMAALEDAIYMVIEKGYSCPGGHDYAYHSP